MYLLPGNARPQDYTTIKNIFVSFIAWGLPSHHFFIKGFGKIYKGKFHRILFLLSFLLYWTNQFNSFARMLHLYWAFSRYPF